MDYSTETGQGASKFGTRDQHHLRAEVLSEMVITFLVENTFF